MSFSPAALVSQMPAPRPEGGMYSIFLLSPWSIKQAQQLHDGLMRFTPGPKEASLLPQIKQLVCVFVEFPQIMMPKSPSFQKAAVMQAWMQSIFCLQSSLQIAEAELMKLMRALAFSDPNLILLGKPPTLGVLVFFKARLVGSIAKERDETSINAKTIIVPFITILLCTQTGDTFRMFKILTKRNKYGSMQNIIGQNLILRQLLRDWDGSGSKHKQFILTILSIWLHAIQV